MEIVKFTSMTSFHLLPFKESNHSFKLLTSMCFLETSPLEKKPCQWIGFKGKLVNEVDLVGLKYFERHENLRKFGKPNAIFNEPINMSVYDVYEIGHAKN